MQLIQYQCSLFKISICINALFLKYLKYIYYKHYIYHIIYIGYKGQVLFFLPHSQFLFKEISYQTAQPSCCRLHHFFIKLIASISI